MTTYGELPRRERARLLRRAADQAEWDIPEGRIGSVVRQHRQRARVVGARSRRLLTALLLTVLIGLVYYIGLPLVQNLLTAFSGGAFQRAQQEIAEVETRLANLEPERDRLWDDVVDAMETITPETPAEADAIEALTELSPLPGSARDTAMAAALAGLSERIADDDAVDHAVDAFEAALSQREALLREIDNLRRQQAELRLDGLASVERQRAFADYLAACRDTQGGDPTALTSACIAGFTDLQRLDQQSLWDVVAERAPPAILLLFLLSTLGGLYRYNMRLAGFHQTRADALELLSLRTGADDVAILAALSEALAADKVAFGKAATPGEQALDLTKAVLERVKS